MTSALPPPLPSKISLSSPPPLPQLSPGTRNHLTSGHKGKAAKGDVKVSALPGFSPGREMSFVSRSGCLSGGKVASVSEGWAGRLSVAWRISEEGEGRRPSGGAAWLPQPALSCLSSSFRGRLHQNLPPPPTPTHKVLASVALTSTCSAAEGLESQSFSYCGARRPCASMARDGLAGKVRLFLRVQRAVASPPARPLCNRSCVSLSGARHMVPLPAAAPCCLLVAARRGCSDRGRRRLSIREEGRREGGVAWRACAGRAGSGTGSRGCAQPGHLPHASLGPGSEPRAQLRRRLESPRGWRRNGSVSVFHQNRKGKVNHLSKINLPGAFQAGRPSSLCHRVAMAF
ncbi:uncharacterized protein LOC132373125 [Balaenoptera ricei]|uniref:uncharacterized protein LOC132373125 n=1 Tax=Balaenoptera ricei TaxID=2746895 RepID=UPI0028BEA23A|nr:uncharacterized protein LOC132373125 [Balaenoptera ricei]